MMQKPPAFWTNTRMPRHRVLRHIFTPLSWVWRGVTAARLKMATPYTASIPVICIGNATVGGTGKTPTTLAAFELITTHTLAQRPCILTRGYGATQAGPVFIAPASTPDFYAGDEPLLMAKRAPVIISRDRVKGLKLAEDMGFDCVICDDGLQNPHFTKTLSILVIDGPAGFGNGAVLPAGPLRAPLSHALGQVQAAIIIGSDTHQLKHMITGHSLPVFQAHIVASDTLTSAKNYVAFAGIGRPQKFFDTLADLKLNVVEHVSFPDHYLYTEADCTRLQRLAARHNATLVTTEKDWVRLAPDMQAITHFIPVMLQFDTPAPFTHLLQSALRKGPTP